MQDLRVHDMNLADQAAGHENAEIVGHEIPGQCKAQNLQFAADPESLCKAAMKKLPHK